MSATSLCLTTSGCTRISSSTWRARPARADSSMSTPDSLAISMLTPSPPDLLLPMQVSPRLRSPVPAAVTPRPACRQPTGVGGLLHHVVARVRVDDVGDQLVPDHIVRCQLAEVHIRHAV